MVARGERVLRGFTVLLMLLDRTPQLSCCMAVDYLKHDVSRMSDMTINYDIEVLCSSKYRPPYPYFKITVIHTGKGNVGNIPLVLIVALCRDPSNPFGDSEKRSQDGNAYISFRTFESGVGTFWPSIMKMISQYIPEEEKHYHEFLPHTTEPVCLGGALQCERGPHHLACAPSSSSWQQSCTDD